MRVNEAEWKLSKLQAQLILHSSTACSQIESPVFQTLIMLQCIVGFTLFYESGTSKG